MTAKILVFENKFARGWNGDDDALKRGVPDYGKTMTLREALTKQYETDAHFVQYYCPGNDNAPRINKPAIGWFELNQPGEKPELQVVGIDLDFPDHGESGFSWHNTDSWPDFMAKWYEKVVEARRTIPELAHAGVYCTRGGMRFIWPLAETRQVGVDLGESYITQFVDYLQTNGLDCDRLTDWTRMFRLPFVVRDGVAQKFPANFDNMRPLDWAAPEPLASNGPSAIGEAAREDMPDPHTLSKPRLSDLTPFKGQDYYDTLRNANPLSSAGARHVEVLKIAGSIVSIKNTNDPLVPFQLMLPSIQKTIEMSPDRRPPLSEVWDVCLWVCRVHDGTKQMQQQEQQTLLDRCADAMHCERHEVRQRLILTTKEGTNYYVFNERTLDYESPTGNQQMLLALLQNNCPRLSGVSLDGVKTGVPDLLKDYSTAVDKVVLSYSKQRTEFDAKNNTVYEAIARIDKTLVPVYDAEIDGWLRALFNDRAEECLDWLATFLDFDRATCALYVHGPPSIGKGMLASGIARLWNTVPTPYKELSGDFQGSLKDCPLIVADEKVPEDPFRENDSSVFRQIIGNGRIKVNAKYKAKANLEGFPRVLITANNADALRIREALEKTDIAAIQRRIGYVKTTEAPREYIEQLAHSRGMAAQEYTQAWVKGGGIAQHILWLHKNREVKPGDRFMVEGWPSKLTEDMSIKFGSAPLIGKFIGRVILNKMRIRAVIYGDGEIWANTDYMRDSWNQVMGKTSNVPGDNALMTALKVLSDGNSERRRAASGDNPRYYWQIEPERIARIAEEFHLTDPETILTTVQMPSATLRQVETQNIGALMSDNESKSKESK